MKKIASAILVLASAAVLVGCGSKTKTGVGYGLVHGHYLGEATVEVKEEKLTKVTFEEYYLPYNAAALVANAAWATVVPENVVERVVTNAQTSVVTKSYYAKYFLVDTKLFVGSLDEANVIKYEWTSASVVNNIETWIHTEANALEYVAAIKANKVFVVDAADATTKSTALTITGNAANGWKKSETGYWSGSNYPLGWAGNMEKVAEALVTAGVDAEFTRNAETKLWETEGFTSGATLTDFEDYQVIAQRAVANAK